MDGGAMSAKPTRDLAAAQTHLHQPTQAAALLKREVAVSRSHGDPGHSRCRTWFVDLRSSRIGPVLLLPSVRRVIGADTRTLPCRASPICLAAAFQLLLG